MKSSSPRWPNSCPLFAVNTTSHAGGATISARSDSNQHTMPPPRSAVDCHHELRGVMTTTGGRPRRVPVSMTTTLKALARVRRRADETRGAALRDSLEYGWSVGACDMHGQRAIRVAELLGVEEPHAGPVAGADDDERAMRAVAANALELAGIDRARRQFGDADLGIAADRAEPTTYALCVGGWRVEHRHRRDLPRAEFDKAFDRVEPGERQFLDRHACAERRRLPRQPARS